MKMKFNNLNYKLVFAITVLASFVVWACCVINSPYSEQLDIFFVEMANFWADGTNTTGLVAERNPYLNDAIGLENAAYPPLAYDLFYLLARISVVPEGDYLTYYYQPLWTMFFTMALYTSLILIHSLVSKQTGEKRHIEGMLVGLAVCLSRPMLYTVERGNILIITALALMVFCFYYDSENKVKKELALICLAIAAGIKLTPAVFGILLVYKKDWWAAVRTVIYGLAFFIVPFFFLTGGVHNLLLLISNVQLHFGSYSDTSGTGLIASFVKYAKMICGESYVMSEGLHSVLAFLRMFISGVLLVGAATFKEKWKVILNVCVVLLILPAVSGEYCLLYLLPFIALFLKDSDEYGLAIDKIALLFGLIMIHFVYRCGVSNFFDFSFGMPLLTVVAFIYSCQGIINFIKNKRIKVGNENA